LLSEQLGIASSSSKFGNGYTVTATDAAGNTSKAIVNTANPDGRPMSGW
jgi:hypothetical protein